MRVWHVNLTWCGPRVDGIAVAVERLAAAQSAAGADVQVFCPVLDHRSRVCAIRTIGRELRRPASRPDVVHFHSLFRLPHTGLAPILRRLGVPYVVSPHSAAAPAGLARRGILKRAYTGIVEHRFLRRAAAVLCLTEAERADVGRFAPLPPDSAVVVPNPVDPVGGIVWEPPRPPARPRVVTLSRFDVHQKGLDRLCAIARRAPEVDFVVHGEIDKNAPGRAVQLERAAPPNLSLRPPVFGSDKDEALRRSTLFILPSRWEGLSMSLAEALAAGVPCAVSTEVAATLPVAAEGLGLVLDRDPDAAAEALRSAIDDPGRLHGWSHAGAAFAADHFDPEVVAQRTLGTYATAAAGSR